MNTLQSQDAATPPLDESTRLIPLTQGKFAIVDSSDYEWLMQWKWQAGFNKRSSYWRAQRRQRVSSVKCVNILMHRQIMGIDGHIDHRDGNGLNNSRSNLRPATVQQNNFNRGINKNNSHGRKGVTWDEYAGKWKAHIGLNRRTIHLGRFTNIDDAAKAYDNAARKYHGEFYRQITLDTTSSI